MFNNVFVLCTGRCGSTTFIRACSHITNYTSGHETRCSLLGEERLSYPLSHIEADNRLSWLLGRLWSRFGSEAFYVHLVREEVALVRSLAKRVDWEGAITRAYRRGILMLNRDCESDLCADYVHTVNANIEHFMDRAPHKMRFHLEAASSVFPEFWRMISAVGDLQAAMLEWQKRHNSSV